MTTEPPPDPSAGSAAPSAVGPGICEAAAAGLLLLLALAPNSLLNSDGDTAHHLAVGRQILTTGTLTRTDLFSAPHFGRPWLNWEWLADLLFAAANSLLGLNGVAVMAAALIAGTLYGLCRWCMARGLHPVPTLVLGLLAATTSEIHWLARPHLFSFTLLLLVLYYLEEYRTGRIPARRLAFIPPLMTLWANLHPAFVIGLVFCGAYWLGAVIETVGWGPRVTLERATQNAVTGSAGRPTVRRTQAGARTQVRAYTWTGVVAAAATVINPYGIGLHLHIIEFLRNPLLTRIIVEYQPPDFSRPITWPFAVLLLLGIGLVATNWRRVPATHLLLLGAWSGLALQAVRNVFQFSLITPALLAPLVISRLNRAVAAPRLLARYGSPLRYKLGVPWLFAGTLAGLVTTAALGGWVGPWQVLHAHWTEPPFPIRAAATLTTPDAPSGPMFNDMTWGGYLLYQFYPQRQIFIDGQQDAYGLTLSRDYLTIAGTAPGWDTLLDQYGIAWVIEPPSSPLVAALRAQPTRWRETYRDSTAVILRR